MTSKKLYQLLVFLFPIIYLFHKLEEWLVLRSKATMLIDISPKNIGAYVHNDPSILASVFGIAVVFATVLPVIVSFYLWKKLTPFNAKILVIIAFATFINTISHIFSSITLGFIAPGLITGIVLCIPYAIGVTLFVKNYFPMNGKQYLSLGFISLGVYFLIIVISWLFAAMCISNLN